MSEWISVFKEKPEINSKLLLMTESGEIVTGWLKQLRDDDIYYCIGNEFCAWDYEFNYYLGAITHWMPLPAPPACGDSK